MLPGGCLNYYINALIVPTRSTVKTEQSIPLYSKIVEKTSQRSFTEHDGNIKIKVSLTILAE